MELDGRNAAGSSLEPEQGAIAEPHWLWEAIAVARRDGGRRAARIGQAAVSATSRCPNSNSRPAQLAAIFSAPGPPHLWCFDLDKCNELCPDL